MAQSGFIPSHTISYPIRKLLNNIQIRKINNEDDNLHQPYILQIQEGLDIQFLKQRLIAFKFVAGFYKMIEHIYGPNKAQMQFNTYDSDPLTILRGSKQDCPLSPLLFNLAIEALELGPIIRLKR